MVTPSTGAGLIFDPRVDDFIRQLAIARANVVSLTEKLSILEDAPDKAEKKTREPCEEDSVRDEGLGGAYYSRAGRCFVFLS